MVKLAECSGSSWPERPQMQYQILSSAQLYNHAEVLLSSPSYHRAFVPILIYRLDHVGRAPKAAMPMQTVDALTSPDH